MKLYEIIQDGVKFELYMLDGEGYTIFEDENNTRHHITAPDKEHAIGYFEDYVRALL